MSGQPVQHEKPDYAYVPKGLMAEPWGKQGHRTPVAEFIQKDNLLRRAMMDNDSSRDALMYIASLDDATVLAARLEGTPEHAEVCRRLGGSTWDKPPPPRGQGVNPLWVTMRAANVAYDRDLIDEIELDRIARDS